jgi:hypothetical protein
MNKAFRMVVINTVIALLFKMPISFMPILNVYAEFYYKRFEMRYIRPAFARFFTSIIFTGFNGLITDLADFLYILSISIQPLIYRHFDKKIKLAFNRLIHRTKEQNSEWITNVFNNFYCIFIFYYYC